MTQDLGASLIFFLAFFAGLAGLLTALYYLEATLDGSYRAGQGPVVTKPPRDTSVGVATQS